MLKKNTAALGALLALTLSPAVTTVSHAQSGPLEDLSAFPTATVKVLHGKRQKDPRVFNVWIANTQARQEQGLMFAQGLPQGQGMFLALKKPRRMTMWMKDTYMELDMLFIDENGAIIQIVEHARPLALDKILSQKDVLDVLEIGGGEASRLEIKVGDHIDWTAPDDCDCTPPVPEKKPTNK
jgi:uncharacterized protein